MFKIMQNNRPSYIVLTIVHYRSSNTVNGWPRVSCHLRARLWLTVHLSLRLRPYPSCWPCRRHLAALNTKSPHQTNWTSTQRTLFHLDTTRKWNLSRLTHIYILFNDFKLEINHFLAILIMPLIHGWSVCFK